MAEPCTAQARFDVLSWNGITVSFTGEPYGGRLDVFGIHASTPSVLKYQGTHQLPLRGSGMSPDEAINDLWEQLTTYERDQRLRRFNRRGNIEEFRLTTSGSVVPYSVAA